MARVVTARRLAELTNRELGEVCGTVTVARGLAYAREGRVVDVEVSSDGAHATGWVGGSAGQTYTTQVALRPEEEGGRQALRRWHSQCSCPVAGDCKHAVAVAARVRELAPAPAVPDEPPTPTWERALGGLLDEDVPRDVTPVGLLIESTVDRAGRARLTEDTGRGASCGCGPSCRGCAAPGSARGSPGRASPAATTATGGSPTPRTTSTR